MKCELKLSFSLDRVQLGPSQTESHTYLAHALVRYLGASSPADLAPFGLTSPIAIVDLLSRFATNALTLSTPALAPIGVFVSPVVALFNHNCVPNAAVVFPELGNQTGKEVTAIVIALRDISPGEEVSYITHQSPIDKY
jgi:hypothetical protein